MKPGNSSASLRTKLIRTVLLACLILSLLPSVAHAQQTAVPKRILKLYWYDQDRSVTFHQSFQAALQSAPAGTVEYYPEYLESLRFPGENQSLLLRDYLRKKYVNRTIDVVVATPGRRRSHQRHSGNANEQPAARIVAVRPEAWRCACHKGLHPIPYPTARPALGREHPAPGLLLRAD